MLHFSKVLMLLDHERYCSGQRLAEELGVTRATIHNCIAKIESLGIHVQRVRGLGYRLAQPVDLLSEESILNQLPDNLRSLLASCHCLQEIDSTNQYALDLAAPDAGTFCVVTAETQTSGRGRRGRSWVSPYAANAYVSILWPLQRPIQEAGVLSPFLAYSVLQSLQKLGVQDLGLKWPNDVYCQGKKLAGLLIECSAEIGGRCKMIVGLGVNVSMSNSSNVVIDQAWTDIVSNSHGWNVSRNRLIASLTEHVVKGLMAFEQDEILDVPGQWDAWDIMKNKNVQIHSGQNIQMGIARGIDSTGRMLLETSKGLESISAGDASLRISE